MTRQALQSRVKQIVEKAEGIARLQGYLVHCDRTESKEVIMALWEDGSLTEEEAKLLIGFNALGAV